VQGADIEAGQFGDAAPGVGDHRGHGGGTQRYSGVGVRRPADDQVVEDSLGVGGGQVEAAGGWLTVTPVGQAQEPGEGVVGVDAHAHGVGIGSGTGTAESVAGAELARGRVGEPCVGPRGIHQLADRDLEGAGGLLGMVEVLIEEVPADAAGGAGEPAVGQMPDEVVNGVVCRGTGLPCRHAKSVQALLDNSKMRPCTIAP